MMIGNSVMLSMILSLSILIISSNCFFMKISSISSSLNIKNKLLQMCNSNNMNQWNLMKSYHAGSWFGFTSKHDIDIFNNDNNEENDILDARLIGTTLQLSNNETLVTHINSIPKNYTCMKDKTITTSLLKDDIIQHNMGCYDNNNITSKFCYNVALGGPSQTPNGDVYLQFSLRHMNYRFRVLLRYEAIDSIIIKGTSIKVPSIGGLVDCSISREKLQIIDNIIDLESLSMSNNPESSLYDVTTFNDDQFQLDKIATVTSYFINENPNIISDSNDLSVLMQAIKDDINSVKDTYNDNSNDDDDDDDDDDELITARYAGNMFIVAPTTISTDEASIILTWIIPNKVIYRATLSLEAYLDSKKKPIKGTIQQPIIKHFSVDEILYK